MKCDFCDQEAVYKRVNRVNQYHQYGNPYHPPKFSKQVKESEDLACTDHYAQFVSASIGGPHRWRKINSNDE
jgi:hypothetical protein